MLTQAVVIEELNGPFVIKDVILADDITEHEVLVRIVASGICHSDLSYIDGTIPNEFPCILGHEGAGIIEKVGTAVSTVVVGDKVLLSFSSCKNCKNCRYGKPNICKSYNSLNLSGVRRNGTIAFKDPVTSAPIRGNFVGQSSFAKHTLVDESAVTKVPENSDLKMLASVGCGQITGGGAVLNVIKPINSSSIAIFGIGAVGAAAILASAMSPMSHIIAIDLEASRLVMAKELGATHIVNGRETKDVVAAIFAITNGEGVDYAIDCSGNRFALRQAYDSLARGGTFASVGIPPTEFKMEITVWEHIMNGRTYLGAVMGGCVTQEFIRNIVNWHSQGKWPLEKFSKQYSFKDIGAAFDAMKDGSVMKPILIWD